MDVTKLRPFAVDESNVAEMTLSLFIRVENTMGKGEHAGYQHFLLFQQCFFKNLLLLGQLNSRIVFKGLKYIFEAAETYMSNSLTKEGLTRYQTTNFRLFQTERVCRRQFQI